MGLIADAFRGPLPWVLSTWEIGAGIGIAFFVGLVVGLLLGFSREETR